MEYGGSATNTNYQIEVSTDDGENWNVIYLGTNRKTDSSTMLQLAASSNYKKKFILYHTTPSPAGTYAPARSVILDSGQSSLNATSCPSDYPNSAAGADAKTACYTDCQTSISNGTATPVSDVYYNSGNSCRYTVACNTGYNGTTGTGVVTTTPACTAKCVRIVLQQTLAGHSPKFIYSKYNDKTNWYSDASCTQTTSGIEKPTADDWEFGGYWLVKGSDENMQITADATLPASETGYERVPYGGTTPSVKPGSYTSEQTWYARWVHKCVSSESALCLGPHYDDTTRKVQYVNCCLVGYHKDGMDVSTDGTTCPSGT